MPDASNVLLHVHDCGSPHELAKTRFMARAINHQYMRSASWPTDADEIPDIGSIAVRHRAGRHREALIIRNDHCALVEIGEGSAAVRASGMRADAVDALVEELRALLPVSAPNPEAPTLPVTFWSYHPMGVRSRRRKITVPAWTDCRGNYPLSTRDALRPLMSGTFEPGAAGQLLLWHGEPGTGKTYALRALAWQWRAWCDLHYITDPEVLFGENASYMLDVLLDDTDDAHEHMLSSAIDDEQPAPVPQTDPRAIDGRWRLLVLEDTGEMMSADARERAGQGLGRLLNVVDGLIGQGLRILVLVTTNERIGKLHPAVARPGRCASRILFERVPYAEAVEWLGSRGHEQPEEWIQGPPVAVTAADLYAIAAGDAADRDTSTRIGFT